MTIAEKPPSRPTDRELRDGFESFVSAARRLEESYAALKARAEDIDLQLAEANARLETTLQEREAAAMPPYSHQALLRARPVAGSASIAAEFERIRRETLVQRVRRDQLRSDVISMREKMRAELDRSDAKHFDLKHGRGGIGDIEFLVQYLVLDNAAAHTDVIYYSDNIRQLDALVAERCIDKAVGDALQDAYRDYRLRYHHLVLDDRVPVVAIDEFVAQRQLVAKTWDEWLG